MKKTTLRQAAMKLALLASVLLSPLGLRAQTTVTIGDGTVTSNTNPIGTYYNYSITEQLYTADEIGMAGTISSISFYYKGNAAKDLPITVYMANVDAEDLSAGGISLADADEVFTGTLSVPATAGWVTIELDNPFTYDGTSNLLIGCIKDYLYYFNGQTWQGTATTSTMARYTQNDYDAYTTSTTPGTAQANRPNIQLVITPSSGGDVCEKPATCVVSDVTSTSATLTWTGGSGTYNVEVKGGSYEDWTAILTNTALTDTTLTLQPTTTYQARVQSVCDGSTPTSGWKTCASFATPCDSYDIPYTYDFETAAPFNCWTPIAGVTRANSSYDAHASSYYLEFSGTTSNLVALPQFNEATNTLRVEFWTRPESTGGSSGKFAIGYMTDITDASTFVAVETYNSTEMTTSYVMKTVDLVDAPANATIAFRQFDCSTYYYWYVDDVTVKEIPSCFKPTEAHATVQDANNATISWTPNPSNADGGSYSILDAEYNPVSENLTGTSFALSDLEASHDYTYYVQTNCFNSEEDEYVELVEVSFSTPADCAAPELAADAFTNVSAHQATVSWTGFTSNNAYVVSYRIPAYIDGTSEDFNGSSVPTGWTKTAGVLNTDGTATLSGTSSWSMGTSNNVFDKHIYMNMYSTTNYWLITPEMTLNEGAALSFDIAYTAYSTDDQLHTGCTTHRFAVLISTDNMATWTILREWNNSGSTYVLDEVSQTGETVNDIDISSYAGQTVYIAFFGHSQTSSYDNNFHLDNVTIGTPIPATAWQTVTPNPTTATTTITGLTAETPYEVKVKGLCNGGAESEESDIQSFTTTIACPAPTTLVVAANATDATTMVDLTWAMGSAETAWQICVNGDEENLIDINESAVSINNNTVSYTLTGLIPGQDYTFKVRANCEASVTGDGTSDWSNTVSIQTEATCTEPTAFNHGTPDVHSVDLTWTESGTATQWQLCVNDDMEHLLLISPTIGEDNNVSYTLSGLTGTTNYSVKVRAYCAAGDGNQSPWVGPTEFRTACEAITIFPWSENFESYTASSYGVTFAANCWENIHLAGSGSYFFEVYSGSYAVGNSTNTLRLRDMNSGTMTKLRLPVMDLPDENYQFSIDVYRNASGTSYTSEGVRVYASTDGEIEGATELGFLSRNYTQADGGVVGAENASGWYTYEFPIPFSGTCYIILRGESQYGSATYMDNFIVEQVPTCRKPKTPVCDSKTAHTATLSWTNGAEGQTAWQIAYKAGSNFDPFDAEALATATIVDVTSNPATITLPTQSTAYYAYVRANCGNGDYSDWSVANATFSTLAGNNAPTNLAVSNLASTTATISWTRAASNELHESYELYYSKLSSMPETLNEDSLVTGITTTTHDFANLESEVTYYVWVRDICGTDGESDWTSTSFTTLPSCPTPTALAATNITNSAATISWTGSSDVANYTVQYRTAEDMNVVFNEGFENGIGSWTLNNCHNNTGINTSANYSGNNGFRFYYSSNFPQYLISPELTLDETAMLEFYYKNYSTSYPETFKVGFSSTNNGTDAFVWGEEVTASDIQWHLYSVAIPVNTKYMAIQYTSNDQYYLYIDDIVIGTPVAAGEWNDATEDVAAESFTIEGLEAKTKYDVQVKSNCTNGEYSAPYTFTTASVFTKSIQANKWYAIATPAHDCVKTNNAVAVDNVHNLTAAANDLYSYDEANGSWMAESDSLMRGTGYIYRSAADANLSFVGYANTGSVSVNVSSSCPDIDLKGFNLIGNPYPHAVAINRDHYTLNANGSWTAKIEGSTIGEAEACLVYYSYASYYTTYSFSDVTPDVTLTSSKGNSANSALAFTVSNDEFEDVAYARFDNGEGLPKIGHLAANAPMLSIPVEGRRYAIANLGSDCQSFNLVFRGVNGTYTIKQSSNQAIAYCHLIDRVAGKEIDMLRQNYTFSSNGFDADRFMVKLSPDAQENANGNFAYWNGNSWMVEGNGTLQVFDALGRQLFSQEISNSNFEIQNSLFPAAGVYVLRMGEKTQKIVVR